MTLRPGDIVLIRTEYHQRPGGKLRPAVILLDSADEDFVAAPITSHRRDSDFDVSHKLTVLAKDEIVRRLGELGGPDRTALAEVLRRAFSLKQ